MISGCLYTPEAQGLGGFPRKQPKHALRHPFFLAKLFGVGQGFAGFRRGLFADRPPLLDPPATFSVFFGWGDLIFSIFIICLGASGLVEMGWSGRDTFRSDEVKVLLFFFVPMGAGA